VLGSSLSKCEYTVVNLGHADGPPRLITCVKSSQGFDWNQGTTSIVDLTYFNIGANGLIPAELFLPSYVDYDSSDLEHKPDPVHEIMLTDEEAAKILPQ
jgi:hypothetical protein